MKATNILFYLTISLLVCNISKAQDTEKVTQDYVLIAGDSGILAEVFDSTIVDENKYNRNNSIYKVGNRFVFSFNHLTADQQTQYFKINDDRNSWSFVGPESKDDTMIKTVVMTVADGNPFAKEIPDYNQTNIVYTLKDGYGSTMTGVIENEGNVWIHPPREKYFEILELNPFPYIKAPYSIGTKWTWNLIIGDLWADGRWKLWSGQIENKYKYEIVAEESLQTALGEIDCFVIESDAESRIGKTQLTAYFNPKYGFVKLDYTNIDGSKTFLELVGYSEGETTDHLKH